MKHKVRELKNILRRFGVFDFKRHTCTSIYVKIVVPKHSVLTWCFDGTWYLARFEKTRVAHFAPRPTSLIGNFVGPLILSMSFFSPPFRIYWIIIFQILFSCLNCSVWVVPSIVTTARLISQLVKPRRISYDVYIWRIYRHN